MQSALVVYGFVNLNFSCPRRRIHLSNLSSPGARNDNANDFPWSGVRLRSSQLSSAVIVITGWCCWMACIGQIAPAMNENFATLSNARQRNICLCEWKQHLLAIINTQSISPSAWRLQPQRAAWHLLDRNTFCLCSNCVVDASLHDARVHHSQPTQSEWIVRLYS